LSTVFCLNVTDWTTCFWNKKSKQVHNAFQQRTKKHSLKFFHVKIFRGKGQADSINISNQVIIKLYICSIILSMLISGDHNELVS